MFKHIRNIFKKRSGVANPEPWLVDLFGGGVETNAGRDVDEDTSLQLSTVYACVTLIAESIASLPLGVFRKTADNGRDSVSSTLNDLVKTSPNPEMTSFDWRLAAVGHLLLYGNSYSLIERNRLDQPTAIWPIVPERVSVVRTDAGKLVYKITAPNGVEKAYNQSDILHVKGFGQNGLVGQSVISFSRESIGLSLAAEEYGSRFFGSGANPGLIIEHPGKMDSNAAKNFRDSVTSAYAGLGKSHKTLLIEDGMKASSLSIPPSDSQFIELREFQREEICSLFKVPPHMVSLVTKSTSWGSGIEQQQINFVVNTLRPWLVRWEQSLAFALLTESQRKSGYFFDFLVAALLRGDIKTRYESYRIGRQWGWLSVNDVRRLETMNPVDNGNDYLMPMNMVPLGTEPEAMGLQDKQAEPDKEKKEPKKEEKSSCECDHEQREYTPYDFSTRELSEEEKPVAGMISAAGNNSKPINTAFTDVVKMETDGLRAIIKKRPTPAQLHRESTKFYESLPPKIKSKLQSAIFRYQDDVSAEAQKMIGKGGAGKDLRRELSKFKAQYIGSLSERYTGDGLKQVRTLIANTSANSLIGEMDNRLDAWDLTRSARYADEELIRAGNSIARETWARSGVIKLRWVTRGSKTCPYCRQLSGKIVGIEKPFLKDGETLYASDGKNFMAMSGKKSHPPIHKGCVCMIQPEKG